MRRRVIVLAGGGTGGHVFPLVAVADALRELSSEVRVVFAGTARGLEARVVPERGDVLEVLDVAPIKGRGALGAAAGALGALASVPRALALLGRVEAGAVLAAGGYASGPVGLAAWLSGVPLAVLEPNGAAGLANRCLMPLARRIYLAFGEHARRARDPRARRTGIPLRGAFRASAYSPSEGALHVLVLGGSQGAAALNEVAPPALELARRRVAGLSVLHQAGRGREGEVLASYAALGLADVVTVVPFLDDVAAELGRADLVLGRAGASFLGELAAVGRASILIPFPFAADDHQRKNAEALARDGAAIWIAEPAASAERLAEEITAIAADPARRLSMADRARALGRPEAARTVARDLLELAGLPVSASTLENAPAELEARHV